MSTQLSPDGYWWWDGAQWVSAISPDGRWRWDGERWVVNEVAARPVGPVRYEPTPDTRRVQLAVIGWLLVSAVYTIVVLPATFQASMQTALRTSPTLDPGVFNGMMTVLVVFAVSFGLIWAGLLIYGTWSMWRWVYYLQMILGALSAFSILSNALALAGIGTTALMPIWTRAGGLVFSILNLGLGIWLFLLWRRYKSAWAREVVPA